MKGGIERRKEGRKERKRRKGGKKKKVRKIVMNRSNVRKGGRKE